MATGMAAIRRVVTGTDAHGRSKLTWDGAAPHPAGGERVSLGVVTLPPDRAQELG